MTAAAEARVDVAILGGGIAGLWLLARLVARGRSAVLLEADRLGAGQSAAAQGIIHGGLKYGLDRPFGAASQAVAEMPALWRDCLAGRGEVDLRQVRLLAERQLFWLPPGLLGAASGFLAARFTRGRAGELAAAEWPMPLQGNAAVGAVWALQEPVLEVASLLAALARPLASRIRRIRWPDGIRFERSEAGAIAAARLTAPGAAPVRLVAGTWVCTAGAGNEALASALGLAEIATQRRPLCQLMVRHAPAALHAHRFDPGQAKPRITVTSHVASDGALVWYLGGELAERGAGRDRAAQIAAGQAELATLFPQLDFTPARFATLAVDRAEPAVQGGARPDGPVIQGAGNLLMAWPSKLALAPRLAAEILARLERLAPAAGPETLAALASWPVPEIAAPPWEGAEWV